MKALITGSSGMVGSALVKFLAGRGWDVVRLVRSDPQGSDILWAPHNGHIDLEDAGQIDAVIHLAGENIAAGRWTKARKALIADSRIDGTDLLAGALARLSSRPKLLISASAVGYYGHQGGRIVDETHHRGEGFLAELADDWESATSPVSAAGVRVVFLRLGMVLSESGGALGRMASPFRCGLGGVIGSGRQYISWVALDDVLGIVGKIIDDPNISGPVNATTPLAVTNREFTKTLGRVLGRPTLARMPAFAARLLFGQMADELLVKGVRAAPSVLAKAGYQFQHPDLEGALRSILAR
jgi:uncharacterized protein (TIGR01777 family)